VNGIASPPPRSDASRRRWALARAIGWGCVRALIGLLAAGILVFHLVAIG
jgi:hypothetical protein